MKLCKTCVQSLSEDIVTCPSCGNEVGEGIEYIDDYRILEILHETHSSIRCRAIKDGADTPAIIRLFTPRSGVDETVAARLKQELEELKRLPEAYFVQHYEIKRSSDGLWYRVSEWINVESWGVLLASGRLQDLRVALDLFYRIASILEGLHQIGHIIPHLILDDIIVIEGEKGMLDVKIDYKLSRFLDAQMDQPGPMLKKLLTCHPDILNQQPLDIRSDIWSLGKIFVELLSGDLETYDLTVIPEELALPREVATLIKVMLAKDPNLRPRSMAEVAEILSKVKDEDIEAATKSRIESIPVPVKEVRGLKRRISFLAAAVAVLIIVAGLGWYYFSFKKKDQQAVFLDFANQYAGSVAFVVVEYHLKKGERSIYQSRTEGTVFLVSEDGYMLTNRHVACPWLEDRRLRAIANRYRLAQRPLRFDYRMFLWFEGERAFKRLPVSAGSVDLNNAYFLESAFRSDQPPGVKIAGVARPPVKTRQLLRSPLKNDFAVLKIDRVPDGLIPLPLDDQMKAPEIQKLSPVMTLGFPLGSQTQERTVNVSVTTGHVRRSFENMIQVDTSIYKGNSGGPIIDLGGKVIGIASAVAVDMAPAPVPVLTLLSDIGMVLPITKAAAFLKDLKDGQVKWNGVLDLSVKTKIKKITELATQKRWTEAQDRADKELEQSFDPLLVMAAGIMHFCAGDDEGARRFFNQALSMNDQNDRAKFMLYLSDWMADQPDQNPHQQELLSMDWRSPSEFFGHLARILEERVDVTIATKDGYSEEEISWLYYVAGLMTEKQGNPIDSEQLMREAVLAADREDWLFFMALSRLDRIQRQRLAGFKGVEEKAVFQSELVAFMESFQQSQTEKAKQKAELLPLMNRIKQAAIDLGEKQAILKEILKKVTTKGNILAELVYCSALNESWDEALQYARSFLEINGRENVDRLSIGLLEPEILYHIGRQEEAMETLSQFTRRTKDPWYRRISESLVTGEKKPTLTDQAGESPEYLLTVHVALGFWAEGSKEKEKAINHYQEALETYMDDRFEYQYARERIQRLR